MSTEAAADNNNTVNNGSTVEKESTRKVLQLKELLESIQSGTVVDNNAILTTLQQLKSLSSIINQTILQSTQIGIAVNKLSKSDNEDVKTLAKAIVTEWKALVLPVKRKAETLDNNNATNSTAKEAPATAENKQNSSKKVKETPPITKTPSNSINSTPIASPSTPTTPLSMSRSTSSTSSTASINPPPNSGMGLLRDNLRNKIQLLLFQAMGGDVSQHEAKLAVELENAIFTLYNDTDNRYKTKYREIAMNLKDPNNPELNNRLLSGEWSCNDVVRKSVSELASEQLKQERQKDAEWHAQEIRSDLDKNRNMTDMFRCGKCRERKCTYYQKQTRSADEPMTVFVNCTVCGNRWKC
jgi:transcription elongation factor S-II